MSGRVRRKLEAKFDLTDLPLELVSHHDSFFFSLLDIVLPVILDKENQK